MYSDITLWVYFSFPFCLRILKSFHELLCHLYIFFGEMLFCVCCPFSNWAVRWYCYWISKSIYISNIVLLVLCQICSLKYFPPVWSLSLQKEAYLYRDRGMIEIGKGYKDVQTSSYNKWVLGWNVQHSECSQ